MNPQLLTSTTTPSKWSRFVAVACPWLAKKYWQGEEYLQAQVEKDQAVAEKTRAEARQLDAVTEKTRVETQRVRLEMALQVMQLRTADETLARKLLERIVDER